MSDDLVSLILERLDHIEGLPTEQRCIRGHYSTDELATELGKAEFTVSERCQLDLIHAERRRSGRGKHASWVISHSVLLRIQREGPLPELSRTRSRSPPAAPRGTDGGGVDPARVSGAPHIR